MRSCNEQVRIEAAEWFVELDDTTPGFARRQAFDSWLRRSPEHVQAFLELLPVWEQGGVKSPRMPEPEQLIARALADTPAVVSLPHLREDSRKPRPARARLYAIAAGLALVVLAALPGWRPWAGQSYATGIAEQRSLVLDDGTALVLNARSRVRLRFTREERSAELLAGQALFTVAPDRTRPFVVRSGGAQVRVVGTRFDVNRRRSAVLVTVLEGRVAVSPAGDAAPALLSAGEQTVVSGASLAPPRPVDTAAVTAWTGRRLMFRKPALADVVEEFNRYNPRPMRIADPALEGFLISGTFESTDPSSFLRFLREQPGIRVLPAPREILIAP